MSNNNKTPAIRFKGFTDTWEQRKLGDHSEIVAGGTPNTGHPEYWNPKEIPWMSSGEINNKVIYSTDNMISKIGFSNSSAKWVKEKSVLIALAGQGKTRGTVAISEIPLTTNQSIAAIHPDSFLYYKFLFQNLEGRYNELREVSSGDGTRGGLNKQIISDLEVLAPEIQEQIKIGDFLCGIDTLITLHQRKCDKLIQFKAAMLQKMFPQNGANKPEIRFKGFSDAWEQRKVQDVADRFDNLRIPVAANLRVHGTTPYYGANGIQDYVEGFTHDGEFVLVAEDGANDLKNYPVKCVNGRIWVNNHAHVLQGKAGIADNSFLAFAISQSDIESLLVGGGRAKLNAETLMSIEFRLPCLQEQYRIGEYLTQLDHLITLHQRKCDKYKSIKAGLIRKLFP